MIKYSHKRKFKSKKRVKNSSKSVKNSTVKGVKIMPNTVKNHAKGGKKTDKTG